MIKLIKSYLFFMVLIVVESAAQGHQDVFPLLYGMEAQSAVADAFTPNNVLNYNNARDTLFKNILGENDSLACVYTGHKVYMNPAEDPTTTVFQNGGTNGINTEHTWPQAYGAGSGAPRSNMYHLFPTRIKVNEVRASFPFAEIPDAQTQAWYYLNQSQSNTPADNIEKYSEYRQSFFEPREDFKGDIARAMFYFYTIYNEEAKTAPDGYFENQLSTLYQWHLLDPVGEKEWNRNQKIAIYQDNKSNPYILDSTLVGRVFCEALNLLCTPTSTQEYQQKSPTALAISPNPNTTGKTSIQYELPDAGYVQLKIFNAHGVEVASLVEENQSQGKYQIFYDFNENGKLPDGMYFYTLSYWVKENKYDLVSKVLLLR